MAQRVQMVEEGTDMQVSRAFIDANTQGSQQIVAAQGSGNKIRVIALVAIAAGAVTMTMQSAGSPISPGFAFAANGGMALTDNSKGWFETVANEALNASFSAAVATGVHVVWVKAN